MRKLEKQLEFEFMKEERKQEKLEKTLIYLNTITAILNITTVSAFMTYLILNSYTK